MEDRMRISVEPDIAIRSMRLDDIGQIDLIEREAFATPWSREAFYNELTNNHFAHYLVMELGGEIIGYGGMWIIMDEAHVTNIAIQAKYRGKKLGERLLQQLQSVSLFLGAAKMTLEVRVSNTAARGLYTKLGFREAGLRRKYYSDNQEDAIIMWVDLSKSDAQGGVG